MTQFSHPSGGDSRASGAFCAAASSPWDGGSPKDSKVHFNQDTLGGGFQLLGEQLGSELPPKSCWAPFTSLYPKTALRGSQTENPGAGEAGAALWCPGWIQQAVRVHPWGIALGMEWGGSTEHPGERYRHSQPESSVSNWGEEPATGETPALAGISVRTGSILPQTGFVVLEKQCPPMAPPFFSQPRCFVSGRQSPGSSSLPVCSQLRVAGRNIFLFFLSLVHLLLVQFAALISEEVFNHSRQGS